MSSVQSQIEKKFEIHVKEHPGELLQHINSAWKERRLCDFLIKVGSKEIPVHKIIFSEGSDYFKAMFSHKMKEVKSGVAVMEGVDPEYMLICIEYIYTGKVSVPESKVQPLLQVASMLQLTRLCEVIGAFLEINLDPDSFVLALKIANTFNLQGLKDCCEKYALENFNSIVVKEEFKDLETEFVKFLIENKETKPLVSESLECLRKLFKSTDVGNVAKKNYEVDVGKQENMIAVLDKGSKSIQAFSSENKTWTRVHDISEKIAKKNYFTAIVFDENVFTLASDKTNYKLNYTDPDAKWFQLPTRTATDQVVAVSMNGEVYAFHDGSNTSQTIEKLNLEQTFWSQMKKYFPCRLATVIAVDCHIYAFGGFNGSRLNNVAKFDTGLKTWSNLTAMPTARYGAGSSELNGQILVIGG